MDHVAIMKKSWRLVEKILTGQKKIESRWYVRRCIPWGRISKKDTVYFKNSGEPVRIKAEVRRVIQFSDLNPRLVKEILALYGKADGIDDISYFFNLFKNKRYCILVFLKNVKKVKPFNVNKKGFGSMSAWISVKSVRRIIDNNRMHVPHT